MHSSNEHQPAPRRNWSFVLILFWLFFYAIGALVDPLTSGAKVKVTGAPRYMGGTLELKLRTLTAAD